MIFFEYIFATVSPLPPPSFYL